MQHTQADEGIVLIRNNKSSFYDFSTQPMSSPGYGTIPLGANVKGFPALLRNHDFLRLWLAQLISMTMLNASNYATLIIINEVTGSATFVGLALLAFSIPAVLLGVPAGLIVDRVDRRFILWASNALRAVVSLCFVEKS